MSYSQTDLESIKSAILSLATGKRTARVAIAGKVVEYHQTDLAALRTLRNEIRAELSAAAGTNNCFRMKSSKGF